MRRVEQDCDPTAYMYTPRGRKDARIGHFSQASTVAAKQAARCQANQHCKHTPEQNIIEPAKRITLTGKHNSQTTSA